MLFLLHLLYQPYSNDSRNFYKNKLEELIMSLQYYYFHTQDIRKLPYLPFPK